jgi:hypothetical protein
MLGALGVVAGLVLGASQAAPGTEAPLAPLAERQKLRSLASEFARAGERQAVDALLAALQALGDEAGDLARLDQGWERSLAGARPAERGREALVNKLERLLEPLTARLATEGEPRRTALARVLHALDSAAPEVNAVLGRQKTADGAWLTPEEARWMRGARAVADELGAATALNFEIERGESENPTLRAVAGSGRWVRAGGVELHSTLEFATLERILSQALRAAALSRALVGLEAAPAPGLRPRRLVLLATRAYFGPAQEEALANAGLAPEKVEETRRLDLDSFRDRRGYEVVRWLDEARLSAVILWRLQPDWIPPEAQPCLRVGHLNWVCLRLLGTSLPLIAWQETAAGTGAQRSRAANDQETQRAFLWRTARRTLWGCRAWMTRQAREGRDPPWARAMLDQDGKIRDEVLLKTTLVSELLQEEGLLAELLRATQGAGEPVRAFEAALSAPLSELEARWRRWLDPERPTGLLQTLRAPRGSPTAEPDVERALTALNQARANALAGQDPEIPLVLHEPELARASELHARYLTLNPAQKVRWPDVHEELARAPGFTPEGALAGSRSLVSFERDPVAAIEGWLGTYYHRLPLLNPGLFGVGLGRSEEVVVLDTGSLVLAPWKDHVVLWPLPEAEDVPRAFVPEIPNPVPGADMAQLGQPVSVQLFFVQQGAEVELALELFAGGLDGAPVASHFLSPQAPLQVENAPPNAWGLVPKRWLEPRSRYTARARWSGAERVWSFTTRD